MNKPLMYRAGTPFRSVLSLLHWVRPTRPDAMRLGNRPFWCTIRHGGTCVHPGWVGRLCGPCISIINHFFADHEADTTPLPYQWEALKCVLRGIFIQQGTRLKKDRASTIRATQASLQALEQEHKQTPSEASLLRVSEARSKLNDLYGKGYLHFRDKSGAASYELGNKCGRLVARALHPRQASTYIFGIKGKNDRMFHHPTHIAETFRSFYSDLYNLKGHYSDSPPDLLDQKIGEYIAETSLPTIRDSTVG